MAFVWGDCVPFWGKWGPGMGARHRHASDHPKPLAVLLNVSPQQVTPSPAACVLRHCAGLGCTARTMLPVRWDLSAVPAASPLSVVRGGRARPWCIPEQVGAALG